jgi:hypothetical protein
MPNREDYLQRGESPTFSNKRVKNENVKDRPGTTTEDFVLPSSTIKDIDKAIYNHFDESLNIFLKINKESKKVPVMFATGERWALVRKRKPLRDGDGRLILPLITVSKGDTEKTEDMHGIPGDFGELIIKRKIGADNPNYQNLINQTGLINQKNVHLSGSTESDQEGSRRTPPGKPFNGVLYKGKQINQSKLNPRNIYEIYSMGFPDFVTITYEVIVWTQYSTQNNTIVESVLRGCDWKNSIKLDTDKGYYYIAILEKNIVNQSNKDDFSDTERLVKSVFTVKVMAYIMGATDSESVPITKMVNAPQLRFETFDGNGSSTLYDPDKLGDDVDQVDELSKMGRKANRKIRKRKGGDSSHKNKNKTKKASEKVWFFNDVEQLDDFFAN